MSSKAFLKIWTAIMVATVIGQVRCSLIVLPAIIPSGTHTHFQSLDNWCANMTGHLYGTTLKFERVEFNKTSQVMTSGITESQRLAFDRRDLQIYSLLFEEIKPDFSSSLGQTIQNCVTSNRGGINILVMAMKISEMYLNGTIPYPAVISPSVVQNLRYQDIASNMATLKAQFRKLAEIIGKTYLASVEVR